MTAKKYLRLLAVLAGAAVGWALGESVASGITAQRTSFWARGELLGTILQWGGALVGGLAAWLIINSILRQRRNTTRQ